MKFSPETLMAYADGELDAQTREAIEAEMAADPQVAREVERHRAMRAEVGQALSGVLDEQIPDRLIRAAKAQTRQRRHWSWPEWTAIAASLLIGVFAGRTALQGPQTKQGALIAHADDGRMIAVDALARALSEQLSAQNDAAIDIGLSFRATSGEYCRTFAAPRGNLVVGFACRDADDWRIEMLSTQPSAPASGDYRMASTQLPAPIVAAIAETMQGEALDADQETAARQRGWRD
jgi:hypothetical protein